MLPLTPEDEPDPAAANAGDFGRITAAPAPSPGKYVFMKKCTIAASAAAAAAAAAADDAAFASTPVHAHRPNRRSATLGSAGRSATVVVVPEKASRPLISQITPLSLIKPKTLDIKTSKTRRLLKSQSKKATLTSSGTVVAATSAAAAAAATTTTTTTYSMYDENFIRYVNELDSYFKVSELRHQCSNDTKKRTHSFANNHITFPAAADVSRTSVEVAAVRNVDSSSHHRRTIPQISLNSSHNGSNRSNTYDEVDENSQGSDNISFSTTMDQDRLSLMTSTPDYDSFSFFVTPSQGTTPELSCYLTAEENTFSGGGGDDTDTYLYKLPEEYGSQETLFNAASDYEEGSSSFRSISSSYENGGGGGGSSSSTKMHRNLGQDVVVVRDSLSKMKLGFCVRENILSNSRRSCSATSSDSADDDITSAAVAVAVAAGCTLIGDEENATNQKIAAKVRRSNFVRTSCIDLDDDYKSDQGSTTVVTLQDEERKKESYFKCCPV